MSIKCYVCHHETEESRLIVEEVLRRFQYMLPYKLNSTKMFESEFFMNVDIDESSKYIGMLTYRVTSRSHVLMLNIGYILSYCDTDVVSVNYNRSDTLTKAEFFHSGFKNIWVQLMKKILPDLSEKDVWNDEIPMFYNNYWFAKPKVILEYREFLKKAVDALEEIPEVYLDSGYSVGNTPKEALEKITGKPYYTFHSFVLERLPCIFVWYKKYSCLYTCALVHACI